MPDDSGHVPAMICHYAAYMRAWLHVTPEISMNGSQAELRLNLGKKMFVAVFGCRKKNWSLHHVEIRRGEQTATFTRSELAQAMATLLGHEPLAPTPPGDQRHLRATNRHHAPRTAHYRDPRLTLRVIRCGWLRHWFAGS